MMKVFAIITTTYLIASSQAATNYLPKAGAGNQCEAADTYNQCIDNGLATTCSPTDNTCNCKQAQILVACVNYCTKDLGIAGLGAAQQSEVTKWCATASSATASPTSVSSDLAPKPTNSLLSSASVPSKASPTTSPTGGAGSSNGKSGAGKMEMCMGLLGIIAVISYLV